MQSLKSNTSVNGDGDDEVRTRSTLKSANPYTQMAGRVLMGEFKRAFRFVGSIYCADKLNKQCCFWSWIADCNKWLQHRNVWRSVGGAALLSAIFGHGHIAWQNADARIGAPLENCVDPYSGRLCTNAWRSVLDGTRTRLKLDTVTAAAEHERHHSRHSKYGP